MAGWTGEAEDEVSAMMVCILEIPNQPINQSINHAFTQASPFQAHKSRQYDISITLGIHDPDPRGIINTSATEARS